MRGNDMALTFTVLGKPIPLPRSRSAAGKRPYIPIDHPARVWQVAVGWDCLKEMRRCGWARPCYTGDIGMNVTFWGARANADIDNLAKAIMDALTGTAYGDDRQIVKLTIERRKVDAGHPAGAYIEIEECGPA